MIKQFDGEQKTYLPVGRQSTSASACNPIDFVLAAGLVKVPQSLKGVKFFSHRLLNAKIKYSGPRVLTEVKQASGLQKALN